MEVIRGLSSARCSGCSRTKIHYITLVNFVNHGKEEEKRIIE
jgi:hypothetical protein